MPVFQPKQKKKNPSPFQFVCPTLTWHRVLRKLKRFWNLLVINWRYFKCTNMWRRKLKIKSCYEKGILFWNGLQIGQQIEMDGVQFNQESST